MLYAHRFDIGIRLVHFFLTSAKYAGIIHCVAAAIRQHGVFVAGFRCEVFIPYQRSVLLSAVELVCQLTALHLCLRHQCHAGGYGGTYLVDIIAS